MVTPDLSGIDVDAESPDERSDFTLAARYMNYEVRGEANADEIAWLHAHPVQWMRALKVVKQETARHIRREYLALAADPRKPDGRATARTHTQWSAIRAEAKRKEIMRRTFIAKIDERIALVRELLPHDVIDLQRIGGLIIKLLDIEEWIRSGEVERARRELAHLILALERRGPTW